MSMFVSKDLSMKRFGRLVALNIHHREKNRGLFWECVCDCGKTKVVRASHLISGGVRSCGCLLKDNKTSTKHGLWSRNKRLHKIWSGMIRRCEKPDEHHLKYYKEKNICVCEEWHNPIIFEKWALANGYKENLTIDRIDNNGNYCPDNCRWVTILEQSHNTRRNIFITIDGIKKCLSEWCRIYKVSDSTIRRRVLKGMDYKKAFEYKGHYFK